MASPCQVPQAQMLQAGALHDPAQGLVATAQPAQPALAQTAPSTARPAASVAAVDLVFITTA